MGTESEQNLKWNDDVVTKTQTSKNKTSDPMKTESPGCLVQQRQKLNGNYFKPMDRNPPQSRYVRMQLSGSGM